MATGSRSELSKGYLTEAMFLLLEKKPFAEISVTELCEKAGVSRLTFYRNFETREQVILDHYQRSFQSYLQQFSDVEHASLRDALVDSFRMWQEDRELTFILSDPTLSQITYRSFAVQLEAVLEQFGMGDAFDAPAKSFILGGIYHTLVDQILADKPASPEEIVDAISKLLASNALA